MNVATRTAAVTCVLLTMTLLAGCGQELMTTPNLYTDAKDNPFKDVPTALQSSRMNLLYATDRVALPDGKDGLRYGYDRSQSLAFGECVVEIGRDMSWNELVKESRTQHRSRSLPIAMREIHQLGSFPVTPAPQVREQGTLVDAPESVKKLAEGEQELRALISKHLALTPRKDVFIFVHGFNNTFDHAACVLAELWHFLGRGGVPMLYTWPAGSPEGALGGYTHDSESGEFTGYHIKQFLRTVASCPDVQKIHLIAHSRGADVLTTALRELHIEYQGAGKPTRSALKLGHLVLAAADLDVEVSSQKIAAEQLLADPERMTVYVSPTDWAIRIADLLFGSKKRVGQIGFSDLTAQQRKALESMSDLGLIETHVRTSFIGHDYFYSNPAVSSDLILLLRDNRAPGIATGRPLIKRQENYWEIQDGYPRTPPR